MGVARIDHMTSEKGVMSDGLVLCPSFPVYPYLWTCQCIAASDAMGQKAK